MDQWQAMVDGAHVPVDRGGERAEAGVLGDRGAGVAGRPGAVGHRDAGEARRLGVLSMQPHAGQGGVAAIDVVVADVADGGLHEGRVGSGWADAGRFTVAVDALECGRFDEPELRRRRVVILGQRDNREHGQEQGEEEQAPRPARLLRGARLSVAGTAEVWSHATPRDGPPHRTAFRGRGRR